ncbi:MAG: hypothetical protein Q8L93_01740 [Rhodocyclaceae bacterium]|nr:hypothetical protein [Rhodocyclaceae bacterium]MDP1957779.1 hypothetical protein [Rhodocyclaceae bacterium]
MDLYFSPVAQLELDEAFAYLEGEKTGLGYRFTADVDEALCRIQMHPLAWHPLGRKVNSTYTENRTKNCGLSQFCESLH